MMKLMRTCREASYYGVLIFFQRFATIFVFLTISLVFTNVGWAVYEPKKVTSEILLGLRVLMCIFPAIALFIAILAIYRYPLDGEYLRSVKEKLQKLHEEKKMRV